MLNNMCYNYNMKLFSKKEAKKTEEETIEARREEVLAAGRKFKYPLQWTRYRVVINTVLIALVVFTMVVMGVWLALYRVGMTDDLLFNVTKVVPLSVASVDEEKVRFSDYLMFYRSSMISIERQSGSQFDEESFDELRAKYKRAALTEAEKYTYAIKLAKEQNITVTQEEINEEFNRHLNIGGVDRSEEGFLKIIRDNFGLSKSEYERMLYLTLMKAKVEIAIDEKANKTADKVEKMLVENGNDYKSVAEQLGDEISYEETGGMVDDKNIDGGRAAEAMRLEPDQSSGKIVSSNGDGYYFVKLIKKDESEVDFVSIKVPFTEFEERFDKLKEDDKIVEYIETGEDEQI